MKATSKQMVTIPKDQYDEMLEDCKILDALRGAGVDNWEGYSDAMELMDEEGE